jgi:triosephosphate isomerase
MATGKKIIAGNWKMNGTKESAWALVNEILESFEDGVKPSFQMIICPPFTLIPQILDMAEGYSVAVGAQNCNDHDAGAFTGEISANQIRDLGAEFVIVGHSERRTYYGETSSFVAKKARAAIDASLTPIICIGETLEEKEGGKAIEVIAKQFAESIPENATADNIIIAYEPVWAIGTGKSATVADIVEIHSTIKELVEKKFGSRAVPILYGGSVKPGNAAEIFSVKDVDGALIGGASLKASDFLGIAKAA